VSRQAFSFLRVVPPCSSSLTPATSLLFTSLPSSDSSHLAYSVFTSQVLNCFHVFVYSRFRCPSLPTCALCHLYPFCFGPPLAYFCRPPHILFKKVILSSILLCKFPPFLMRSRSFVFFSQSSCWYGFHPIFER